MKFNNSIMIRTANMKKKIVNYNCYQKRDTKAHFPQIP